MIISHSDQTHIWNIDSPMAGVEFLNDSDEYLDDGDPQTVCRFSWGSGAQLITSYVEITALFAEKEVRVFGLIGTTLPVGTLVGIKLISGGIDVADLQGSVVALPHGQRGVWVITGAAPAACDAAVIKVLNNVNGVVGISADEIFEIGEVWLGDADEIEVIDDWSILPVDPLKVKRSVTSRAGRRRTTLVYRRFACKLDTRDMSAYVGGNDLRQLLAKIDRGQSCVVIPRHQLAGVDSADALHATVIFGIATSVPGVQVNAGDVLAATGELVIEEVPALPA